MKYPAYLFILPLLALAGCTDYYTQRYLSATRTIADIELKAEALPADDPERKRLEKQLQVHEASLEGFFDKVLQTGLYLETPEYVITAAYAADEIYKTRISVTVPQPVAPAAVPNQRELQEVIRAKDMEIDVMRQQLDAVVSTHPEHRP